MRSAWGLTACTCVRAWTSSAQRRDRNSTRTDKSALIHDGYERTWHATTALSATQTRGCRLEAFLVSTGVIALAEIGDKTQWLALVLAARFRAPLAVIAGILTATLANHLAAGALGTLFAALVSPGLLRWLLVASFLATAAWMLLPERGVRPADGPARFGAYGTSAISFFLMEIGDKTQLATFALAAKYHALLAVVAGTSLGMMLADVPVVLLGEAAARRVPLIWVQRVAAGVLVLLALLALPAAA